MQVESAPKAGEQAQSEKEIEIKEIKKVSAKFSRASGQQVQFEHNEKFLQALSP